MKLLRNPIRLVPSLFLLAIAIGTLLLSLPIATMDGTHAPFLTALFTATSAVAVTGLVVVDTGTYWSPFGQVAILLMFQIGGLGIMTAATLFGIIAGRSASVGAVLAPGTELFRLIRQGRLEWRAEVIASELAAIKPGMAVTLLAASGASLSGRVRMIGPTVDPQTRQALVYVDLQTPSAGQAPALAGMYASGSIQSSSSRAVTVPAGML